MTRTVKRVMPNYVLPSSRFIMAELLQTEQTYVKDLEICIKFYFNALRNQCNEFKAKPDLVNKEEVLFSNMKEILEFHKDIFLKELQKYEAMPEDVGHCFVTWVCDAFLVLLYLPSSFL